MSQPSLRAIALDDVKLAPPIAHVLDRYRAMHRDGKVPENNLRLEDYQRWSVVWERLGAGHSFLDVGIGVGQLVNAVGLEKRFNAITGLDYRWASALLRLTSNVEFQQCDLTSSSARNYQADVVTCLECIEHISDADFENAVSNLHRMYRRKLIVSVPFCEPEPLSKAHQQRFTLKRIRALFPGSEITLLIRGRVARWALIEIMCA